MLLDIKSKAISSIKLELRFDDNRIKKCTVAIGDLIDVLYNGNGQQKRIVGRVAAISTVGTDTKNWYIIVDGSDDFATRNARFSPDYILDIEIIRKAGQDEFVRTPLGETGAPYVRENKGRFQISKDGRKWHNIRIDDKDIIEPQEGTVPLNQLGSEFESEDNDEDIEDAIY